MFIGVIGCGSIGKRHINNLLILKKKLSIKKILIYDPSKNNIKQFQLNDKIEICKNKKDLLIKSNAVIVSTPNHLHSIDTLNAIKNNCHVLVEKPFSHKIKLVDQILKTVKKKNLVLMTGYMLRYYKPFIEAKKIIDKKLLGKIYFAQINCGIFLPNWRPHLDYRKNYGAKRSQGGGVVLDLVHEINYAKWFFGKFKKISSYISKLSNLEIDTEDFASINYITKDNIYVSLTLDYLNQAYNRNFKIIGEKATLKWDFLDHKLEIYDINKKKWKTIIHLKKFDFNQTYLNELSNFILSCKNKDKPKILMNEGKEDLEFIIAAFKSSKNKNL